MTSRRLAAAGENSVKDLLIIGAGGLAREAATIVEAVNRVRPTWNFLGFVERDDRPKGTRVGRYLVVSHDSELPGSTADLVAAVGDPVVILALRRRLSALPSGRFPNLIHPSVVLDEESVSLGVGNLVEAGTVLTADIRVGSFNVINPCCSIGHDTTIADGCVINPGARIAGGVVIESGCLIGAGACVLQYLRIGANAIVGAGAVVTRDVAPGTTVVGVPARPIRSTREEPS